MHEATEGSEAVAISESSSSTATESNAVYMDIMTRAKPQFNKAKRKKIQFSTFNKKP